MQGRVNCVFHYLCIVEMFSIIPLLALFDSQSVFQRLKLAASSLMCSLQIFLAHCALNAFYFQSKYPHKIKKPNNNNLYFKSWKKYFSQTNISQTFCQLSYYKCMF